MAEKKHDNKEQTASSGKVEWEGGKETEKKWGKKETRSGSPHKTPWKLTSVVPPARPSERNRKLAVPTALQNNG